MAGNIIPAIATTNAIIAGMVVFQAIRVLAGQTTNLRLSNLQRAADKPIVSYVPAPPAKTCPTSSEAYVSLACDPSRVTLGEVLKEVVRGEKGLNFGDNVKLSVYEGGRLLNEPDYGDDDEDRLDNETKTLEQLGCGIGTWISFVDEEDEEDKYQSLSVSICKLYASILFHCTLQSSCADFSPSARRFQAQLRDHRVLHYPSISSYRRQSPSTTKTRTRTRS